MHLGYTYLLKPQPLNPTPASCALHDTRYTLHLQPFTVTFSIHAATSQYPHHRALYHSMHIQELLLSRKVEQFRGGLVFKAHRWLYHSTLGSRIIKRKKKDTWVIAMTRAS